MPCEIRVEVVQGIDFLQVVNTTLYATTMDFSNDSSLKNHNSYIHTDFSFLSFAKLFISNCYCKKNSKHDFFKVYTCCIAYLVHYGFLYLRYQQSWKCWCQPERRNTNTRDLFKFGLLHFRGVARCVELSSSRVCW
jgi:hypothetical protein